MGKREHKPAELTHPSPAHPRISRHTRQILILLAVGVFLLCMLYHLRAIFNPILLALLIAYILNPVVNLLEKLHIGRTIAVFIIYLLMSTATVLTIVVVLPLVREQVYYLYQKTFVGDEFEDLNRNGIWDIGEPIKGAPNANIHYSPAYASVAIEYLHTGIDKWNAHFPQHKLEWQRLVREFTDKKGFEQLAKGFFEFSSVTLETAAAVIQFLFWVLSYVILLPLYIFFMLKGLDAMWDTIQLYLPHSRKGLINHILHRIHSSVSFFFRGKLIICFLKGLLTWGCLSVLGMFFPEVKFSLIFGGIQAIASIVPFLVLVIGMVPNVILLVLEIGVEQIGHLESIWLVLGVIAMYLVIESIEGFVLTPWIMGKETGLNPVTVIVALLIGGKLFGLFGLILAIPLTTTLKILSEELILPVLREVLEFFPSTGQNKVENGQ